MESTTLFTIKRTLVFYIDFIYVLCSCLSIPVCVCMRVYESAHVIICGCLIGMAISV